MDWRSIPGFMPQGIPTMQQSAYGGGPTSSGGWATASSHAAAAAAAASTLAFHHHQQQQQHHSNVSLASSQGGGGGGGGNVGGYSNGFGAVAASQQFKKSMVSGSGGVHQFGHRQLAYGQAPPVPSMSSHRPSAKDSTSSSPHGHGGQSADMVDTSGLHSLVSVKSEASDIIEVHWESKGSGSARGGGGGFPGSWLHGPSRVTIKSEPIDVENNNPWDTAKSIPAFPTNLTNLGQQQQQQQQQQQSSSSSGSSSSGVVVGENSSWHGHHHHHQVADVVGSAGPPHYGFAQQQQQQQQHQQSQQHQQQQQQQQHHQQESALNRGSCSKKDLQSSNLGLPPYAGGGATIGLNHGSMVASSGNKSSPASMGLSVVKGELAAHGPSSMDHVGSMQQQQQQHGQAAAATNATPAPPPHGKRKKEKKGPPVACKQCGKEFSKSYMKKHLRQHAEMKPYVCGTCNKVFYSAPLLAEHQSAYHDEEKKHQCYVCGHRFHQKSLLKEHLKTHVEKPYKCRVCPRSFSRRIKLNNHEKLHEGAQLKQCDICGKLLKGRVSLKCHMHNMHSDARKKYPCLECGRIFLLERSLTTHRYVVHTGERPFKCPDCGRAFADVKYLKSHLLIHTGEKPYQCNVCGKRFRQSTALWCHKTTHTGIKPHRCPDCGRQSVHRSELAKHKCAARRDPSQPHSQSPIDPTIDGSSQHATPSSQQQLPTPPSTSPGPAAP